MITNLRYADDIILLATSEAELQKLVDRLYRVSRRYSQLINIDKTKVMARDEKKQKECASDLNNPEHRNEIFRMAKQMVKERQDITGSNCLKGVSGKVIVDEKRIGRSTRKN